VNWLAASLAAILAVLVLAAPGAGAPRPKHLWATVNSCDTERHPNMMGVRASMPGDAQRTKMYMRFVAQYFSRSKQLWYEVKGNGRSRWIYVGSGIYEKRQGGYTFGFKPPAKGRTYVLRGVVEMQWRKKDRVVRSAKVNTKGGFGKTVDSDPEGFSKGLCEIR
jgi:hypothetical protein